MRHMREPTPLARSILHSTTSSVVLYCIVLYFFDFCYIIFCNIDVPHRCF